MRHRKAGRKLGRNQTSRKAMFRNMVTSLVEHDQVRTTEAKAKELRRFTERVITIAKNAPTRAACEALSGDEQQAAKAARVHAIRRARRWIRSDEILTKLFDEVAPRLADRSGGYTRMVKAGFRPGDNAAMAIISILDEPVPVKEAKAAPAPAPAVEEPAAADDAAADSGEDGES